MKPPIFVRSLTADERKQLELALRSRSSFIVRRCQILLASSRGERVSAIARSLGCATQTCRNVIRDFESRRLASLEEGSRRTKTVQPLLDSAKCEKLQALLHSSPGEFSKPTSLWTLELAAEVILEQGLVEKPVSREVFAEPSQGLQFHAWRDSEPLKLFQLEKSKADQDPLALCCYGLLRCDTNKLLLRVVDGGPVSQVTTDFLEWVCGRMSEEGKRVLLLIWDNGTWHKSQKVRSWIKQHNKRVKREGGVRILALRLPIKSPWLNPIEPHWVDGKRAVVEAERKLTAEELIKRVCDYFRCEHYEHLKQNVS